jgi:hypothetical protein
MLLRLCKSGVAATLAAIIHVKLTGEGDFGPVDLECVIPPARLPVVMAALFGQPVPSTGQGDGGISSGHLSDGGKGADIATHPSSGGADLRGADGIGGSGQVPVSGRSHDFAQSSVKGSVEGALKDSVQGLGQVPVLGGGVPDIGYSLTPVNGIETGGFIAGFTGTLGDLIARMQPRGFAETILIAAIWLHYRDGRGCVTRDDIRRILRRQEHLRMPRNFSRDFQVTLTRGYLVPVEDEDGYAVSRSGYQWFQSECLK